MRHPKYCESVRVKEEHRKTKMFVFSWIHYLFGNLPVLRWQNKDGSAPTPFFLKNCSKPARTRIRNIEFIFSKTRRQLWLWTKEQEVQTKVPVQHHVGQELIHSTQLQKARELGAPCTWKGRKGVARGLFKNAWGMQRPLGSPYPYSARGYLFPTLQAESRASREAAPESLRKSGTEESCQWGAGVWTEGREEPQCQILIARPASPLSYRRNWTPSENRPTYTEI